MSENTSRSEVQNLVVAAIGAKDRERAIVKLELALTAASRYGLESGAGVENWIYDTANLVEKLRNGKRTDWRKTLENIQEVPA